MILATGNRGGASRRARSSLRGGARCGFTLLEVLAVIGLLGLLGTVAVIGGRALFEGLGEPSAYDRLRQAVQAARYQAAVRQQTVALRFERESATYRLRLLDGTEIAQLPAGFAPKADAEVVFRFFPEGMPHTAADQRRSRAQGDIVRQVLFGPDRSATPFEVTLREGNEREVLRYDPFVEVELVADAPSARRAN